jgi:hypothetical protein
MEIYLKQLSILNQRKINIKSRPHLILDLNQRQSNPETNPSAQNPRQ